MSVATLDLPWLAVAHEGETELAARRGDRTAWSALVARHNQRVVVSLIAAGVMPAVARELAQETWLRLITQADANKLERLQLPGLAIRQALFLARSDARREENRAAAIDIEPPPEPSAEQRYLSHEKLARARAVLATLHPSAQHIFTFIHSHPQRSHAEIAAQVGLSVQRVRQVICEVRKRLRAEIEGDLV